MPRIVYFSVIREKLKKSEEEIAFEGPIGRLREILMEKYPEVEPVLKRVKFAVNEEYVDDSFRLKGDETVAVIPPVSGG